MKDREISFNLTDVAGHTESFTSLRSLLNFLVSEKEFWKTQRERVYVTPNRAHQYLNVDDILQSAIDAIKTWSAALQDWSDDRLDQELAQLNRNYLRHTQQQWLWSKHPYSETFIQILINYGQPTADSFLDFVLRKNTNNVSNIEHFRGYLFGYEFVTQESNIPKRRTGEKISLTHIRNEFSKAKDQLFGEVDSLTADITEWSKNNRAKIERRYRAQKLLGERLHNSQIQIGENKLAKQDTEFDEKLRIWSSTIDELEKTYKEKLKLEGPATYWKKAAKRHGIQGSLWTLALLTLGLLGIVFFKQLFDTWLMGKEIGVQLNTLQGIALYGSLLAIYAFLIRVFSRLSFSSFHLMRDAEEREQLTYLYLSLINENAVDEASRTIVLQALFSRSETGLLASESGPTMPGLHEIIKAGSTR